MKNLLTTPRISGIRSALLVLSLAAIGATPALLAQTPDAPPVTQGPPPGGPNHGRGRDMEEHRLEHMTKSLNLTPDQVTKVKAVFDDSRQQMMTLREDTSTPRDQKHAKMEAIHSDAQGQIKAILTDEQKAKFEAIEAKAREHREEHREHGNDGPPPPPPAQ